MTKVISDPLKDAFTVITSTTTPVTTEFVRTAMVDRIPWPEARIFEVDGICTDCCQGLSANWAYCPSCGAKLKW